MPLMSAKWTDAPAAARKWLSVRIAAVPRATANSRDAPASVRRLGAREWFDEPPSALPQAQGSHNLSIKTEGGNSCIICGT